VDNHIFYRSFTPCSSEYTLLVGFGRAMRLCAARTRLFRLTSTENRALRAPLAHRTFAAMREKSKDSREERTGTEKREERRG
jgi:hypothetical protein